MKSRSLNLLEPYEPVQACTGIYLSLVIFRRREFKRGIHRNICNIRGLYTGRFIMYTGITKIYYRKTAGHVFAKPVQIEKKQRLPSIFKDESTGSCIRLWKLAVAVATYVSICIV
jgi:hypothetical protein